MTPDGTAIRPALSQRLKLETADQHERMHRLMTKGDPFGHLERYVAFVAAQYLFQRDVEHLFADHDVRRVVPDAQARGRGASSLADLADLKAPIPFDLLATAHTHMPEALGWIYVSEGSTLGAAFLLKEAEANLGLSAKFGARNLAAYPEGRAQGWRRFVASLDSELVAPETHGAVVAGAHAAYQRFGALLQRFFKLSEDGATTTFDR